MSLIDAPLDDLNPTGLTPEAAEKVKGGVAPATPPGVPIPYPNISTAESSAKGTRKPGA